MDLKEIQNLIKFVANSGVAEVKLETGDVKITIKTTLEGTSPEVTYLQQMPQNMMQPTPAPQQITTAIPAIPVPAEDENSKFVIIKSPIIGTFYRKPSPDKDVFVNVGSEVKNDTVVCVIEAMKLFNQIEAEVSGKIVKILVDDASPVEYDQPLFLVDPS